MCKGTLVSFIIPTFNCIEYLDETISSVISQLPGNCELIIVDDGSSDGTADSLKKYAVKYDRLKLILREHAGVSEARNAGLDQAAGEWVAFMDCDDCLKKDFFEKSIPLINDKTDLYIFSFERVEILPGTSDKELVAPLMVSDRLYETASDFADDYVRTRHLLVYSACNKLYRKSILDRFSIRFRKGLSFGEDRLFNYDYLMHCGSIATSSVRMFRYMQRNPDSASKRSFPDYYDTIMMLHKAKMECFLNLSEGTTRTEKRAFAGYDLSTEIGRMIDRFPQHPDEKEENLHKINELLFGKTDDAGGRYDILIVLGSRNCGYRAEKALEIAGKDTETVFLVTGGNTHKCGEQTEAGFMSDCLRSHGIEENRILVEEQAQNTFRNLELSAEMIEDAVSQGFVSESGSGLRIGIVTAGFHIPRTKRMVADISWYRDKDIVFIPAYGEHTRPDNWYEDPAGRSIGLSEIAKTPLFHIA